MLNRAKVLQGFAQIKCQVIVINRYKNSSKAISFDPMIHCCQQFADNILIHLFTGNAYGDGVYFAKDASYSKTYSKPGPNGDCFMYLARVLVGKYTVGEQGWKKPPPKDLSKPEILFDSLVNREENPTIFVVFNDFHVYPTYLISFKKWELS